jgi:mannose-1-phosphate guanylyltransferase
LETNESLSQIRVLLLAAGLGTRLKPFTDLLPKCLMPISGKPLLEIWLDNLLEIGISDILVNLHYKKKEVTDFLSRKKFPNSIHSVYEPELLGTAGTLSKNYSFFKEHTTLLVHADNLCICDLKEFINFHFNKRPSNTQITMMTFETDNPKTCGIVELDASGVVQAFHEKVSNPPGNLANAAIYLIEREVLDWIQKDSSITDFSTQVLPNFIGKIATWKNENTLKDIGNPQALKNAQNDVVFTNKEELDEWEKNFQQHPIHSMIKSIP